MHALLISRGSAQSPAPAESYRDAERCDEIVLEIMSAAEVAVVGAGFGARLNGIGAVSPDLLDASNL